jgi:hypothetical protein
MLRKVVRMTGKNRLDQDPFQLLMTDMFTPQNANITAVVRGGEEKRT